MDGSGKGVAALPPAQDMTGSHTASGVLGRLRGIRERLGWGMGVLYLVHRALRAASRDRVEVHCYRLMTQPVAGGSLVPDRWRGQLEVRMLAADEAGRFGALSQAADLPRRQRRGDTCLAAFQGGQLVGHLWLCFTAFDDDETRCRFAPAGEGGAWDFDLSVLPESRGGAVFAALWDGAWAVLRQGGYRWTGSRVSAFNDLSLRSHRRLGARPVGSLLVLRVGGCRAVFASMRPYVRLAGRNTPYIRVDIRTAPERSV